MTKLLLVDGSSYLYRAFHALPDLRNRLGEPTGAIFGVLNMLRRLHTDYRPDFSACVFDARGKTFRDELYPQYKATRTSMPDDLAVQIEPLCEAIRAMGWPLVIIEGVEADDVIGTLARSASAQEMDTIISTGDKDMAQLVGPLVTLVNTMSNEKLDEAGVYSKFGVQPARFIDYLTLIGDSIDNVPGVEKVGPKTAAKWITQYGTLENLIAHAHEIGGGVGENLRKAADWLPQAKRLLTIRTDLELNLPLEGLVRAEQDTTRLAQLLDRFEFKSWRKELQPPASGSPGLAVPAAAPASGPSPALQAVASQPRHYETAFSEERFERWLSELSGADLICINTETTGLDPTRARLVGIAMSSAPHHALYVPLNHCYAGAPRQLDCERVLKRLKPLLEDPARRKTGRDLKYQKHVFANHGIALNGIADDTLLQSYVLESHKSHDMDSLASRHLGVATIRYEEIAGRGTAQMGFDQIAIDVATEYAAEDADITLQLDHVLGSRIDADEKLKYVYREIEMPILDVLFAMERHGVLLDGLLLESQSGELAAKMAELESSAYRIAGQPFNLNSPKQIQEMLFETLKLPIIKRTPGGVPSTDEDVLQQLALDYPLPKVILDYRGLAKLKSTYTDKLPRMVNPDTGRVHTNYAQAVAVTGRLASTDPNLQNIPVRTTEGRRIREAFIAPRDCVIVSADYSQIELRIMAHLSRDAGLLRAFAEGQDIHRATAAEVFALPAEAVTAEQRRYAKVINFGLMYGMSPFGLAAQLGIERAAAQAYIDRYFARYPGVAQYMERTRAQARESGFVETVFGRRLWLPEIDSGSPGRRQGAERAAINAPMQGTAADLIKLAMIALHRWIAREGLRAQLIMQVHDELVLEVPIAEAEMVKATLPRLMGSVAELSAPLVVDVGAGPNWEQAH
jgi:DNA polymerase I